MKNFFNTRYIFLILLLMLIPNSSNAEILDSGKCGTNLTWTLDEQGVLNIEGNGNMYDYYTSNSPWYNSRENIKTVIIGDEVLTIGFSAFRYCSDLTDVIISDSVSKIMGNAFFECTSLENVVIGNGVETIGSRAFHNCTSLNNITIGSSVKTFEANAFYQCNIDTVNIVSISNWCNIAFDSSPVSAKTTLYLNNSLLTDIIFPKDITYISDKAFQNCSSLKTITIPNGIESIGSSAFASCKNLNIIKISETIQTIGSGAFSNCASLESVYIDNLNSWYNIDFLGDYSNPLYNGANLYLNDNLVKEIVIPSTYEEVNKAFRGCSSIESIIIPDGITAIGSYAFANCKNLTKVEMSNGVINIKVNAFNNCENLIDINLSENLINIGSGAFYNCKNLENIDIPNKVQNIESSAFYECSKLKSIHLPDSVEMLGSSAFAYCTNLEDVTLSENMNKIDNYTFYECNSLDDIIIPCNITEIGQYAFSLCKSLNKIDLPINLETIAYETFSYCSKLENIVIPENVNNIDTFAFYECTNLKNIIFLGDEYTIGLHAFDCCVNLENIIISGTDTVIPRGAFQSCIKMKTVVIPIGIVEIGAQAFNNCESIEDVYYEGTQEQWNKIVIDTNNDDLLNSNIHFNTSLPRTFSFDSNGGSYIKSVDKYVMKCFVPTKTNYEFNGWYDNCECLGPEITFPYSGSKTMLYAKWTPTVYTKTTVTKTSENVSFTVKPSNIPIDSEICFICFNDKRLVHVQTKKYNGENPVFVLKSDVDYDYVKICVWESDNSFKPICDAESVSIQ